MVGGGHAAHEAHEQRDVGEAQEDERHHVRQHQLVHQSGIHVVTLKVATEGGVVSFPRPFTHTFVELQERSQQNVISYHHGHPVFFSCLPE